MHSTSKAVSHHHRRRKHLRKKLGAGIKRRKGSVLHRVRVAPKKYMSGRRRSAKIGRKFLKSLVTDTGPKKGKIRRLIKSAPKKYVKAVRDQVRNDIRTLKSF